MSATIKLGKILLFLSIAFLLTNCRQRNQKTIDKTVSIKIEITGKGSTKDCHDPDSYDNYFTRILITNNTDTTFSFWTMKCSWMDSWMFDNDSLGICSEGCDGNYPIQIDLKTKKSIVFYLVVHPYSKNIKQFKMGLIMLTKEDLMNYHRIDDWKSFLMNKKIFWSNSVSMNYWNNSYKKEE